MRIPTHVRVALGYLSKRVYRRNVIVEWYKKDRYGRMVGVVLADGHDVKLGQVRAGYAWWYRDYAKEQTPMDWELYSAAEDATKSCRRELWAEPHGIPPWEWRGTHGN